MLQQRYAHLPATSPLYQAYKTLLSRSLLDVFQRLGVDPNTKEKPGKRRDSGLGVGAEGGPGIGPAAPGFDYGYARSVEYQMKVYKRQVLEGSLPAVGADQRRY
jgi:hypothetical protein